MNEEDAFPILRKIIANGKKRPCLDCGVYKPDQMTYDHIPEKGPKLFNIGNVGHETVILEKAILLEEMAKCEVVCRTCHNDRETERCKEKNSVLIPFRLLSALVNPEKPKSQKLETSWTPKTDPGPYVKIFSCMRRLVGGEPIEIGCNGKPKGPPPFEWELSLNRALIQLMKKEERENAERNSSKLV